MDNLPVSFAVPYGLGDEISSEDKKEDERVTEEIKISVALVTRNRVDSLRRCLDSWLAQTGMPFEIVVSDDSDGPITGAVREEAEKRGCRYIKGPRRGLYANRNRASLACRGTHVLSADDDYTYPEDYFESIERVVSSDPGRIWILTERTPAEPAGALVCPPELGPDGRVRQAQNPSDCAAIADGSTVYPRRVFDGGARYDETYPMGGMWYLWGRILVKGGWRISFTDATFGWHHMEPGCRGGDPEALREKLECDQYVAFVAALWVDPSFSAFFRAAGRLVWRSIGKDTSVSYVTSARFTPKNVKRIIANVIKAKKKYKEQRPGAAA